MFRKNNSIFLKKLQVIFCQKIMKEKTNLVLRARSRNNSELIFDKNFRVEKPQSLYLTLQAVRGVYNMPFFSKTFELQIVKQRFFASVTNFSIYVI